MSAATSPASPPLPDPPPSPYRLKYTASVTRYRACLVDPRPARAVHCPDLNACLVNENHRHRPTPVDCNAVHFGYAIPVAVVPLAERPDLAELVFEPTPDLTPEALAYLLRHHPHTRDLEEGGLVTMATTKHEHVRNKFVEPEEDIAAIAKQISDHAEAIYQTWKSRGLAPAEILNCHSNAQAADKFGTALTPEKGREGGRSPVGGRQDGGRAATPTSPPPPPSINANNLEQLVNNFVVEDKARLAAAAARSKTPTKALPSSIQFALQKFEKNLPEKSSPDSSKSVQYSPKPSPPYSPSEKPIVQYSTKPSPPYVQPSPAYQDPSKARGGPKQLAAAPPTYQHVDSSKPYTQKPAPPYSQPAVPYAPPPDVSTVQQQHYSPKTPTSPPSQQYPSPPAQYATPSPPYNGTQLRPILQETIETTYPCDAATTGANAATHYETLASATGGGSNGAWPLKNRAIVVPGRGEKAVEPNGGGGGGAGEKYAPLQQQPNGAAAAAASAVSKNTAAYMDEVAREEERLINALKTGIIIAEEPPGLEGSAMAEKKKKNLLLKKNKDRVKKKGKEENGTEDKSPTPSKEELNSLSLVDYAKVRYRAAQQTPLTQQRLDAVKELDLQLLNALDTHGHQIEATRTKFENGAADWRPEWDVVDDVGGVNVHRRQKSLPGGGGGGRAKKAVSGGGSATRGAGGGGGTGGAHRPADGVPHPELTNQQRLRAAAHATTNPVRPFLTRGSVAERVLIFEKCPTELLLEKRRGAPAISAWRTGNEVQSKAQSYSRDNEHSKSPSNGGIGGGGCLPPNTTLQRHVRANRSAAGAHIPRFYFPRGKPQAESADAVLGAVAAAFQTFPSQQAPRDKFSVITKACDCPLYWKIPLFNAAGGLKLGHVDANTFVDFWKKMTANCHDEAARFVYILTKGVRNYILPEDLMPLVQDVVDTHPGLTFLKEAIEFHSRYVHTVIARIFYCANRSWSGRVSLPELRRSDLLRVLRILEVEDDINQVTAFFSYEHFYVIYCKFWELDRDHDLFIDKGDLQRHNDHALSSRMIERIFSGAVTRGSHAQQLRDEKMSYTEFVWFLLSEEDKNHPTAIEYWFRCMDVDGDGYLSMYELEYFYEEQLQRLDAIGIETLPFQDCLCQMLDMIHPSCPGKISLSDLRRCKMTSIFFDTFFNLEKYLEHEQKDPFAAQRDHEDADVSDWDRYAADEYEALVAEEGGNEHQDEIGGMYDDFDGEDIFSPNLDNLVTSPDVVDDDDDDDDDEEGDDVPRQATNRGPAWKKPSFKVTNFDDGDEDGDYARDSDDCSV